MEGKSLIAIVLVGLALFGAAIVFYFLLMPRRQAAFRNLMGSPSGGQGLGTPSDARARVMNDPTGKEFERAKQLSRTKSSKKEPISFEEQMFHAGLFTPKEKREFMRLRLLIPFITTPVFGIAFGIMSGATFGLIGTVLGLLIGLQAPKSILDRKIKARGEEIMYYLPLVIEQVAIGVSSSLDIGPCIQRVVSMADERDTHNVVTELLKHAHFYVRSGASLEDALTEIGKRSGHVELKHSFMALSQVAKHGGEISRQLQELANSVASQRETKIEAKIKKLELEATGPVAFVFLGFLIILLVGFAVQIRDAFSS